MAKSKEQPESGLPETVLTVKVSPAKVSAVKASPGEVSPGEISTGEMPSEKASVKRTSPGKVTPEKVATVKVLPEKVPSEKVPPEKVPSEPARSGAGLSVSALPLRRPVKPEDIVTLARDCGEACIEALLDEVENGKGATRIAAARELLERGYGKPRQPLEVSGGVEVKQEVPEEVQSFLSGIGLGRE